MWTPSDSYFEGHNLGEDGKPVYQATGQWNPLVWLELVCCWPRACIDQIGVKLLVNLGQVRPDDQLDMSVDFDGELEERRAGGQVYYVAEGRGIAKVGKITVYRATQMKAVLFSTQEES